MNIKSQQSKDYLRSAISLTTLIVFSQIFVCCQFRRSHDIQSPLVVNIRDFINAELQMENVVESADSLWLHPADGIFMSFVKDLFVDDKYVYVLDELEGILCFDKQSGMMLHHRNSIGHGEGEYISPMALCSSGEELYLLSERACLVYDLSLRYKRKIALDFIASDLIKLESGYLFFNVLPSEALLRCIYTDDNGKVLDSFIKPSFIIDSTPTTHAFYTDENSNVYFSEPTADELYKWNGKDMILCCQTVFSDKAGLTDVHSTSEKENYPNNAEWFVTEKYVVNSFLQDGLRFYGVHERDNGTGNSGMVQGINGIPFYPRCQWHDTLYGISIQEDTVINVEHYILTMFHIK